MICRTWGHFTFYLLLGSEHIQPAELGWNCGPHVQFHFHHQQRRNALWGPRGKPSVWSVPRASFFVPSNRETRCMGDVGSETGCCEVGRGKKRPTVEQVEKQVGWLGKAAGWVDYKYIPCTLQNLKIYKLQVPYIIPNFQHLICCEKLFLIKLNIYLQIIIIKYKIIIITLYELNIF